MLELIRIQHLYGQSLVLDDVSLRLPPGRMLCLAGPSGCGKTTLLHIAAGLASPTSGTVVNRFQRTACVFQEPRLLPWQNALENMAFGLKAAGVPAERRRQVAATLAERLGLREAMDKYPHQLSGGMQQRVALGRALAVKPDLLLLDEPFSALDVGRRRELQNVVLSLLSERRLAAVFVSHDLAEAVRMADELAVMSPSPGRVVYAWQQTKPARERDDVYVYEAVSTLLREPRVAACFRTENHRAADRQTTKPGVIQSWQL